MDGKEQEIRSIWQVGDTVERNIDTEWFAAKILRIFEEDDDYVVYDLEYIDDGNIENGVAEDELRTADHESIEVALARADESATKGGAGGTRAPRPLTGALFPASQEDEEEDAKRAAQTPRVIVHGLAEDGEATAYVINGPENNVATGSGLRGIRW
eukprot:CAMPEP_0117754038 /NCGR_PEP_ID=MMETSP0947-20121206/12594_1 /TAXON_ID=44440 /ORGANISM="Chattonella subsalsa, Strain CCMP2191" /LENGTH=155 /DNA_ID=CAMNT_0005573057 /DNA_START=88 /DNA_END=552 /DNA_ORIENTATION=+